MILVAGGDVAEHLGVLAEMALDEALLDALLALEVPVHGVLEIVLVGIEEGEFLGEGAGVPEAGGGNAPGADRQLVQEAALGGGQPHRPATLTRRAR